MTVRVNKSSFNIREKLSELGRKFGLKGSELVAAETVQEARDLVSAGRKNKIINGAMLIDQRHEGASNTNSNGHHTDRFRTQVSAMDQLVQTYQRVSDGPPGFPKSLKVTTTTAETDISASSEYISVYQKIEGQNLQDFEYGTNNAKPVTISFYVKSSITGTFGYTVYRNDTQGRAINKTYTINNANTWEKKIITIEGDTEDSISHGTGDNWWNVWHLAASPGYGSDPAPTWADYDSNNWSGYHEQNGVVTTLNATWQITGVQLEVGSNATEFEHRSYGEELALCQRYYQRFDASYRFVNAYPEVALSSGDQLPSFPFPVPMRTAPTISPTTITSSFDKWTASGSVTREVRANTHSTHWTFQYFASDNGNTLLAVDYHRGVTSEPFAFSAEF